MVKRRAALEAEQGPLRQERERWSSASPRPAASASGWPRA
jgi:hypothetical protein